MPYKEREINKLYYSIGEVARMFNVNTSLIRFWEKEFEILQPRKNKKGNRLFTQEDLENLKIIYHLVKEKGYTLQGAKEHLKNNKSAESERQRVLDSLQKLRSFLVELKEEL
ncbi:MAG: MerR family transcriptional regulator [Solitalea sp.]